MVASLREATEWIALFIGYYASHLIKRILAVRCIARLARIL